MRSHQLKTAFLRAIDRLPARVGYAVYYAVQKRMAEPFTVAYDANVRSYQMIENLLSRRGVTLRGANILEIGSGWMPMMPYLMRAEGQCNTVYSYDINRHYQDHLISELNDRFAHDLRIGTEIAGLGTRLPAFVDYRPASNVVSAPLPVDVDIVFSRFVLEHVTPDDILAMHKRFAQVYGPRVVILHLISPSDHRAFSDSSLSVYDFLQYSDAEWRRLQTKFDYHNRLRLPQYIDIFNAAGLEVKALEFDQAVPGTEKWEKYKRLDIHPDFAAMSDEQRTAGSINVLLAGRSGESA